MTKDFSKIAFDTSVNYMKRSIFCDSASLTLPAFGGNVSKVITHSLGYIPFYQVFADLDASGTVYNNKVNSLTGSALTGTNPTDPALSSWITTSSLTIRLDNNTSPTATGTRTVYWLIYLDYGNS